MKETVGLRERDLVSGLPSSVVFERARASRHVMGRANRALLFWVEEIARRKLFTELGYTSVFAFCEMELSLDPHTISEMLRTSQCLRNLPGLLAASSDIAPSKLREISRVCVPKTEDFWIEAARTKTCREIEKLVAITPKGGVPTLERKTLDSSPKTLEVPLLPLSRDPVSTSPETPGSSNGSELLGREFASLSSGPTPAQPSAPPVRSLLDQEDARGEAEISETGLSSEPPPGECDSQDCETENRVPLKLRYKFVADLEADAWAVLEEALRGVTWRSSFCMRSERKGKNKEEKEDRPFLLRPIGW
ncbi:MAG: hypothetical protein HYU64_02830 [Armatimonadetes bacterium]|nr:hypothetical protein [Armatimonadota bacterium]